MRGELHRAARREHQIADVLLGLLLVSATTATGDSESEHPEREPIVWHADPCVITETPEPECRRYRLIRYADGTIDRIRVQLTHQQRADAAEWWNRPENRWRR